MEASPASRTREAPGRDESEGFHDYTAATTWEKFSAAIEAALRSVIAKDLPRHAQVEQAGGGGVPALALCTRLAHQLPFRSETYSLTLHLSPPPAEGADPRAWPLRDQPHKLQEWFAAGPCLTLAPDSYSGRILEAEEAHTLLSAGLCALSHLRLPWPLLVPVHDALRDSYRGAAVGPGGGVARFDSDSIHTATLPDAFTRVPSQLELFAAQLRAHSPAAAALCARAAAAAADCEHDGGGGAAHAPAAAAAAAVAAAAGDLCGLSLGYAVRRSYEVLGVGGAAGGGSDRSGEEAEPVIDTWDKGAAWRPWAAQDDPVGCLELDAVWQYSSSSAAASASQPPQPPSSSHASSPPASGGLGGTGGGPLAAAAWRLAAVRADAERDTGRRPLIMLQAADQQRPSLRLASVTALPPGGLGALRPHPAALPGDASFFAMLRRMEAQRELVGRAADVGQLAGQAWWLQQGSYLPPPPQASVLEGAVRDLFQAPGQPRLAGSLRLEDDGAPGAEEEQDAAVAAAAAAQGGPVGKAAPLGSLVSRLALHALRLGNPRAVAGLWSRFVEELRFSHWEPSAPLPHMGGGGGGGGGPPERPDPRHCLLHQKLQLLQLAIAARAAQHAPPDAPPSGGGSGSGSGSSLYLSMGGRSDSGASMPEVPGAGAGEGAGGLPGGAPSPLAEADDPEEEAEGAVSDEPQGVCRPLEGSFLLHRPDRPLNVPLTQEAPPLTEDLLAERHAAVAAAPGGAEGEAVAARVQGALLLSDMRAFKAANPGGCLEDFVRWHSPRDWVAVEGGGRALSPRMAAPGNAWRALWAGAAPAPAAAQRPLFQASTEGERALHFLETLPPAALYAQLLALGASAAAELLGAAPAAGRLPAVQAQLRRLREVAGGVLSGGVAAWAAQDEGGGGAVPGEAEGGGRPAASPPPRHHSALHALLREGLAREGVPPLLRVLGCVEQTVAAGQSLLQRLLPPGDAAGSGQEGGGAAVAASMADALLAAALESPGHGCVIQLGPDARAQLARAIVGGAAAAAPQAADGGAPPEAEGWPLEPFLTEWAVEIFAGDDGDGGGQEAGGPAHGGWLAPAAPPPRHRLYVKRLPSELRVATCIASDP